MVSGDLEVLPLIYNTCKNQTEEIPLVDTGIILIFGWFCQNLSVKELGTQTWLPRAFTVIRGGGNEQQCFMDSAPNCMDVSIRNVSLEGEQPDTS